MTPERVSFFCAGRCGHRPLREAEQGKRRATARVLALVAPDRFPSSVRSSENRGAALRRIKTCHRHVFIPHAPTGWKQSRGRRLGERLRGMAGIVPVIFDCNGMGRPIPYKEKRKACKKFVGNGFIRSANKIWQSVGVDAHIDSLRILRTKKFPSEDGNFL